MAAPGPPVFEGLRPVGSVPERQGVGEALTSQLWPQRGASLSFVVPHRLGLTGRCMASPQTGRFVEGSYAYGWSVAPGFCAHQQSFAGLGPRGGYDPSGPMPGRALDVGVWLKKLNSVSEDMMTGRWEGDCSRDHSLPVLRTGARCRLLT